MFTCCCTKRLHLYRCAAFDPTERVLLRIFPYCVFSERPYISGIAHHVSVYHTEKKMRCATLSSHNTQDICPHQRSCRHVTIPVTFACLSTFKLRTRSDRLTLVSINRPVEILLKH